MRKLIVHEFVTLDGVMPAPGEGGRWTTDAWAPLEGRLFNLGVRLGF